MYILALTIFLFSCGFCLLYRNRLVSYIYDPLVQTTLLSIFSSYFAVPYLMLNGISRYNVFSYPDDSQIFYLLYITLFNGFLLVFILLASRAGLLIHRADVERIVLGIKIVNTRVHWVVAFVVLMLLVLPIYTVANIAIDYGFGSYLANRIVIASGSGYLFATLIFPVFVVILISVHGILKYGVSLFRLSRAVILIVLGSIPVLLTGSRSSLGFGVLIFLLVVFYIYSQRGVKHMKRMLGYITLAVIGIVVTLTLAGAVRQGLMGASDVRDMQIEKPTEISVLDIFGSNENMLWLLSNSDYMEYLYGSTYLSVLVGPIPRAFWAAKPTGAGPILKNWIAPGSYDLIGGENISSYTTGAISESYMNFGWFGVIGGPLIIFLIYIIYRKWILSIRTEIGLVCWAAIGLRFLGFVNAEFYGVFIHIFIVVIFFTFYKLACQFVGGWMRR